VVFVLGFHQCYRRVSSSCTISGTCDYIDHIYHVYPTDIEIMNTTDASISGSYFDLNLEKFSIHTFVYNLYSTKKVVLTALPFFPHS
jgi:hypothetical protein